MIAGAVLVLFTLQFKRVGGGGLSCSWSVYQHKHFCADGADFTSSRETTRTGAVLGRQDTYTVAPRLRRRRGKADVPSGNGRFEEKRKTPAAAPATAGATLARPSTRTTCGLPFAMGSRRGSRQPSSRSPGQLRRYLIAASTPARTRTRSGTKVCCRSNTSCRCGSDRSSWAPSGKDGDKKEPTLAALMDNCAST